MRTYKIQHTESGKYSTGGGFPRFNRSGKAWTNRGAVSCHFTQVRDAQGRSPSEVYAGCVLVILEEVERIPMEHFKHEVKY